MTAVHSSQPPWWAQFVDLTLELGVGTHTNTQVVAQWDRAKWDNKASGTWSGVEPVWIAVDPCNLLSVNTARGRDRWIDRFGASSASFEIQDPDGVLAWGSDVSDDQLTIRPGREVRLTARIVPDGDVFPVWRGWIESIEEDFVPSATPTAKFTAQDGYAQLAHIDLPEQAIVGDGELSSARVNRLLDLAAWPKEWRDISLGLVPMQGTNLARPIADDLGITADSEGGAVYAGRDGHIVFRNRDWLRVDPHATQVQATVGSINQDVCAASYGTIRDAGDIVNDVQVGNAGGTAQRYVDGGSISLYRQRTYQRTDYICDDDTQVGVLGRRILAARASGQVRIPKLVVTPTDNLAEWHFVLGVDYGWRLEVHYPDAEGGSDWVRVVHVQGVAHKITPEGWETELRVDDAVVSQADTWDGANGWDRALWSEVV